MARWYAGVTHSHTLASDGKLTLEQLIAKALKAKLDFLIITDHNHNCEEDLPHVKGLTLIYGTEMTYEGGHANVWGVKKAVDDFKCESYEQWIEKKTEAQRRGALVCMNHPLCTNCPWRWEKDLAQFDALEIWNAIQHYDNMTCTEWWREQLKAGYKTPIVGGSDFHRDYYVTRILSVPTTYVWANSSSPEDILDAIKKGHTTVTNSVGTTMVELGSGDAITGDTVKLKKGTAVTVKAHGLKKGHTLKVFDKTGEIFTHTAVKTGDYQITLPVREPGFVCAHVEYETGALYKKVYNTVIGGWIPSQKNMELPPFIYAQCSAMFFED